MSASGNSLSPVRSVGSQVTVNCTVSIDLSSSVTDSDLSLLMVDVRLFRDGTQLLNQASTSSIITGTTFIYSIARRFDSFGRMDSGNYTCTAEVEPQSNIPYLTASEMSQSTTVKITTGIYYSCMMMIT